MWCYTYDGLARQLTQNYSSGSTCTQGAMGAITYSYAYNAADRLCDFKVGSTQAACSNPTTDPIRWDHNGNRLHYLDQGSVSHDFTYNLDNSIKTATGPSATGPSYTYKPFGGVTGDGCTTYAYDGFDRLSSATPATGGSCPSGGSSATYQYDGLDRQTQHVDSGVGSTTATLFYDGFSSTVSAESNGADTAYALDPAGDRKALVNGTSVEYLTDDGHNNIAAIMGPSSPAGVQCGARYDPFGSQLTTAAVPACAPHGPSASSPVPTSGATYDHFFYRGGRQDSSTGQYQFGSRTYDPLKNSFLTPDSYRAAPSSVNLGVGTDPLTQNTYSYVNGDPVNLSDPSGHNVCERNPDSCSARGVRLAYGDTCDEECQKAAEANDKQSRNAPKPPVGLPVGPPEISPCGLPPFDPSAESGRRVLYTLPKKSSGLKIEFNADLNKKGFYDDNQQFWTCGGGPGTSEAPHWDVQMKVDGKYGEYYGRVGLGGRKWDGGKLPKGRDLKGWVAANGCTLKTGDACDWMDEQLWGFENDPAPDWLQSLGSQNRQQLAPVPVGPLEGFLQWLAS